MSRKRKRQRRARGSDDDGELSSHSDNEGEVPEFGGSWRPSNCTSRHRIAIVVPYRDRVQHLRIFLHHMHPFLQRQLVDYSIYIVEQVGHAAAFLTPWITNDSRYVAIYFDSNTKMLYFKFLCISGVCRVLSWRRSSKARRGAP